MNQKSTGDQSIPLESQQEKLLDPPPSSKPPPLWLSRRFFVAVLMSICQFNLVFLRHNISIAIIDMTSVKQIQTGNSTQIQPAEFDWDSKTIGLILSAFFYGGLLSFMGGFVVDKLGGAFTLTSTMTISGIITILQPCSLYYSFHLFLACRFVAGISESLLFVALSQLSTQWTPKNERSKLISINLNGINIGIAIVHGICAFLAHRWGWPMIFHATGATSLITALLCIIFVKNRPSEDKWITKEELVYIQERIVVAPKKNVKHPYKSIFSSAAVWALLTNRFMFIWAATLLTTFLPMYIKDVTQNDISNVGLIASIPNTLNIFMLPIYGILLDYGKSISISETLMHKTLVGGVFVFSSILFTATVVISNFIASIIFFLLIQISLFLVSLITGIIVINIAPNHTSVISGLSVLVISVSNIALRNSVAVLIANQSLEEWNRCFILTSGILLFSALVFIFYGSSEAQSWAISKNDREERRENQTQN